MQALLRREAFTVLLTLVVVSGCSAVKRSYRPRGNAVLWYTHPAQVWTEALPVGNGRIGAMVYGRVDTETVQLNDESLWAGQHLDADNPGALGHLKEIRQLILEGKNVQAQKLGKKYLLGIPPSIRSYQPVGDLKILLSYPTKNPKITHYTRGLNLATGIAWTRYTIGKQRITREVFASAPDNVIVVHLQARGGRGLSGKLWLTRSMDARIRAVSDHIFEMIGQIIDKPNPHQGPGGKHMKFSALLKAINRGGEMIKGSGYLSMKGVRELTLLLTTATDYNLDSLNFDRSIHPEAICQGILRKTGARSYKELRERSIANNRALFDRVHFHLRYSGADSLEALPTNERLTRFIEGGSDPGLYVLYFNYGRYLLMSSSRSPGILPANLQGIWNHKLHAPWNSDYHLDINLEMNYWPAEITNLSQTALPLIRFLNHLRVPGRLTAREMYGAKGWTVHHLTDEFGRTSVMDAMQYGQFPTGAAWISLSAWRYYAYTRNRHYLRKVVYPILIGAAKFDLSFMIRDKQGQLVTDPSSSPEHAFVVPHSGGKTAVLTDAPTMDIELITQLFQECIKASNILHKNPGLVARLQKALGELPPIKVGKDSTIQEWIKDYKDPDPGFSEMAHLVGLFPGDIITERTPKLFAAALRTIEKRLAHEGGSTGWSRAWIANLYDRLNDGKDAYENMGVLLRDHTYPNLFDAINSTRGKGWNVFQIDANLGGTSAIAHMFVQSTNGVIRILPALAPQWSNGSITGLKARGNFTVGMYWHDDRLTRLSVTAKVGGACHLGYKNQRITFPTVAGTTYVFNGQLQRIN